MHTQFSLVTNYLRSHWLRSSFFALCSLFSFLLKFHWFKISSSFLKIIHSFLSFHFQYSLTLVYSIFHISALKTHFFYLLHILTPQMDQSSVSPNSKKTLFLSHPQTKLRRKTICSLTTVGLP